jgi:hypothetical protein
LSLGKEEIDMGVDIYMEWDGQTEDEEEAQYTGFMNAGEVGYLRGAYFGGHSDVLRMLFNWMSWDEETPFDADAFERNLNQLKANDGERPGKGKWDHTKGKDRGWDLSVRQNSPVDEETIKEYEAFLAFGKRLASEGKNPRVYISY